MWFSLVKLIGPTIGKFALGYGARFEAEYRKFREKCGDMRRSSYELAIRADGINIEHVPSRGINGMEGVNITVPYLQ